MSSDNARRRAPRWLYDGKTPEQLITLRRVGKTPEERTAKAVALKAKMRPHRLGDDVCRIRRVAEGTGAVDAEAERQVAALFLEMWDAFAPTRKEISAMGRAARSETGMTPARAASEVERMAQMRRRLFNGNGRPTA